MMMTIVARWAVTLWLVAWASIELVGADTILREYRLSDEVSRANRISREMTVRVGSTAAPDDISYIDITVWRGECAMRINLDDVPLRPGPDSGERPEGRVVTLSADEIVHRIYPTASGAEWELVLSRRPDTNVFSFDIDVRALSFHRQDSLSYLERYQFGAQRPDSVVGAYVAYHASRAHNRRIINEHDTSYYDYGTGQAFIIYRPRTWDDRDTIWCDLTIDAQRGFLQIAVDSEWLDSARYPVTVDPTFGNTDIGASTMSWNLLSGYCHFASGNNTYTVPTGKTATISSYSVYGSETGAGDLSVNMAAFSIAGGYPSERMDEVVSVSVSGGTPNWFSSGQVAHQLLSSTEYGVAVGCAPRSGGVIYYNSVSDASASDNTNCGLGSEYWTHATAVDFNLSMYATYTEQAAAQAVRDRRRKTLHNRSSQGRSQ